jgi:hypothetical protein
MDKPGGTRETGAMPPAGESRRRMALARLLGAAYGDGLLSEQTFAHRLDMLFGSALIEPAGLVGDLTVRARGRALSDTVRRVTRRITGLVIRPDPPPPLLALDWSGAQDELLIGRHRSCDIVLDGITVSRRHALLTFRDGNWVLRDLASTNGTAVNGEPVVRCRLLPGDRLLLGDELLLVD